MRRPATHICPIHEHNTQNDWSHSHFYVIFGKFYFTQPDADWAHSHGWDDYECGAKLLLRLDCIGLYEFNMVQWLLSMAHYTITIKIYSIYFSTFFCFHTFTHLEKVFIPVYRFTIIFVYVLFFSFFFSLLFLDRTDSLLKIFIRLNEHFWKALQLLKTAKLISKVALANMHATQFIAVIIIINYCFRLLSQLWNLQWLHRSVKQWNEIWWNALMRYAICCARWLIHWFSHCGFLCDTYCKFITYECNLYFNCI